MSSLYPERLTSSPRRDDCQVREEPACGDERGHGADDPEAALGVAFHGSLTG